MKTSHHDHGFTIVEVVIASAILFVLATGAMVGLTTAARAGSNNNMRERAIALANDRMEQARNRAYDDIGTEAGYPTGDIPNVETAGEFTVTTSINWSEDPDTGLSTSKNIMITVAWTSPQPGGEVSIESNIAGKSTILNAGDVKITVLDVDTSQPIQGASISIKPLVGPTATGTTNNAGYARWGKIPAGKIVINGSKSGYALDLTTLTNASVIANTLNEWTIMAARPSFGTVRIRDQFSNPVVGAAVSIQGPTGNHTGTTDAQGTILFDGLLKGTYTVATTGPTGYTNGTGSLGIITSGGSFTSNISVTKQGRAIVTVRDTDNKLVPGARVVLSGSGSISPASADTDANGRTIHVLSGSGTFTASVTKSGYIGNSGFTTIATGADGNISVVIEQLFPMQLNVLVKDASDGTPVSSAAVSVTGPGTVTPTSGTTNASGRITFAIGLPGVYTVNGSKANFVSDSIQSPAIANGGTENVTLNLEPITSGILRVRYTSNPNPNPKIIYIYDAAKNRMSETLSFTARNQYQSITLPAGQYYVSTLTTFSQSKVVSGVVNVGQTTNVSLNSNN